MTIQGPVATIYGITTLTISNRYCSFVEETDPLIVKLIIMYNGIYCNKEVREVQKYTSMSECMYVSSLIN